METKILAFGLLKYTMITTTKLIPIFLVSTKTNNNNTMRIAWFECVL
jgi:hypothetical protein